ncbi:EscI/YscI/HrpB family type III secretion system inner rod protein [Desulfatiglans anilini]|uniref:EscI/YscI/HrpB family type III secretion system inner rod protein n=1 Tax=Desulfatiglans anilini TaxID=90728 RepID=UPI00040F4B26|nr:EscI/YscI/HrpB family type III secretion system inner rod protein [Desulfatiglans anilini]
MQITNPLDSILHRTPLDAGATEEAGMSGFYPSGDVSGFEKAIVTDSESLIGRADAATISWPGASSSPQRATGLGDVILQSIEDMSAAHRERIHRIHDTVDRGAAPALSPSELIRLQYEILQLTIEQELAGKVVDKCGQGVQTLFRNQG